jgi:hypothetical protein
MVVLNVNQPMKRLIFPARPGQASAENLQKPTSFSLPLEALEEAPKELVAPIVALTAVLV